METGGSDKYFLVPMIGDSNERKIATHDRFRCGCNILYLSVFGL